jgi:broad specificity phosphatase PhoE
VLTGTQAAELGRWRGAERLAAVFTSDLGRSVQTAEIAFGASGVPILRDPRLRECNYGVLNGAPVSVVDRDHAERVSVPFPEGESYRDVADRVAAFLADLRIEHAGQRILVVGHRATRWSLDHLLAGADLRDLVVAPFDWRPGWEYVLDDDRPSVSSG